MQSRGSIEKFTRKNQIMEQDKNLKPEKKKESIQDKADQWINKTEEFIEDAAEKIHESETYRKADQSIEKATKKLFRKAGRLWGKSEHYFKNQGNKKDPK